jgi:hypothetical protein
VATLSAWCEDVQVLEPLASRRFAFTQGVNVAVGAGIVLVLAAASWIPDLSNSLRLDETLSFWVVQDGFVEALDRASNFQPQPGYYAGLWFWTQVAGTSEIALRLPSLLAALAACIALAKLGTMLTRDRETGLLAMVVFASTWNVYIESIDARPYMLGVLVLLCMAISFLRWVEGGRWRDVWLCGISAALLPHLHIFFVLTYPAFALHAALHWPRDRDKAKQIGLFFFLLLVGALLFLPAASTLLNNGNSYSFVPPPRWRSLFGIFVWGAPVAGLLAGICADAAVQARSGRAVDAKGDRAEAPASREDAREVPVMLAVWVVFPLVVLFAFSMYTDISVFISRYLIPAIPAVSLLYAIALRGIASPPARVLAAVVIALTAYVANERNLDDFRGAALAVNEFVAGDESVPVLFASGLIEGQDESWLRDPVLADYLISPTAYYPMEGRVLAIPRYLSGQPLAEEIVSPILRSTDRFAAVEWTGNGARIMQWLTRRAEGAGYRVVRRGFGVVHVAFFMAEGGRRRDR